MARAKHLPGSKKPHKLLEAGREWHEIGLVLIFATILLAPYFSP